MFVYGCDFSISRSKSGPWSIYVRKDRTVERTKIGERRSSKHAESFALGWAHLEEMHRKRGEPSQLLIKRRRVRIPESEEE